MPARKTAEAVEEGAEEQPTPSTGFSQAERTIRSNHTLKPINIGQGAKQTPAYRFNDVLNFAHSVGFLGFGPSSFQLIPGAGHKGGPLAVVESVGFFREADGSISNHYAIGDASPENCGPLTGASFFRMADTRAKGRLLRFAMGLDALMADELFDEDDTPKASTNAKPSYTQTSKPATNGSSGGSGYQRTSTLPKNDPAKYPPENAPGSPTGYVCDECGEPITEYNGTEPGMRAFFSMKATNQILCWPHQQAALKAKV